MGSNGPPLVLYHGLTSSIEDWKRDGYVERIDPSYQLILIDGRGHGKSDKPRDREEYRLSKRAFDVTAVLDDLGIERAHYWGISMGAGVGFGLMWQAPQRIDALVLGAGHPYKIPPDNPIVDALANGPEAFLEIITAARARAGNRIPDSRRAEVLSMDTLAVTAAAQYPKEVEPLVEALKHFDRPTLLYAGEHDAAYELIERVPKDNQRVEFVTLPGLDHGGSWAKVDSVVPIVMEFLKRMN